MNDVDFEFDAILYEWQDNGANYGRIHNDKSGRWVNGTIIRTSSVRDKFYDEDNVLVGIQTRNTVYRVTEDKYDTADQKIDLHMNIGSILK